MGRILYGDSIWSAAAKGIAGVVNGNQVIDNERKMQNACVFRHLKIRG
ncbi:MAG: hypothetical protein WBO58_02525 [Gammaproteobacteria bacterium]